MLLPNFLRRFLETEIKKRGYIKENNGEKSINLQIERIGLYKISESYDKKLEELMKRIMDKFHEENQIREIHGIKKLNRITTEIILNALEGEIND